MCCDITRQIFVKAFEHIPGYLSSCNEPRHHKCSDAILHHTVYIRLERIMIELAFDPNDISLLRKKMHLAADIICDMAAST